MLPLLLSSRRRSLQCRLNRLTCVRNLALSGDVQVHDRPAACASANMPHWGGSIGSVADHVSRGLAFGSNDFEILTGDHHRLIARLIEAVYVLQHGTTEALLPLCRQPFEGAYGGTKVRSKVL